MNKKESFNSWGYLGFIPILIGMIYPSITQKGSIAMSENIIFALIGAVAGIIVALVGGFFGYAKKLQILSENLSALTEKNFELLEQMISVAKGSSPHAEHDKTQAPVLQCAEPPQELRDDLIGGKAIQED